MTCQLVRLHVFKIARCTTTLKKRFCWEDSSSTGMCHSHNVSQYLCTWCCSIFQHVEQKLWV